MIRIQRLVATLIVAPFMLGVGLLGASIAAADGPRFSLQPATFDPSTPATQSRFILSAQPGQMLHVAVRVQNTGSTPGTVRLYPVDATTEQASGTVYRSESDVRQDVGAWAVIDAQELILQAGETRNVPFTITVPVTPRPGQHFGGIVAEDAEIKMNQPLGAASVNIKTVTIVPVEVDLPGPVVEKIMLTGVKPAGTTGQQVLALSMRNDGTTSVTPTGTLAVTNAQRQEVRNISLKLRNILPDTAIDYPVAVPTQPLPTGEYDAVVALAYGQNGETHNTLHFTITPAQAAESILPTTQPQVSSSTVSEVVSNGSSTSIPPWMLFVFGAGAMLLVTLPIGAFVLGRSKRR